MGLEAHGSDLNPVAVLITKALIEIPPKFANKPPVNPDSRKKPLDQWYGVQGLAEDVRYYGQWMRAQAEKRIGHLYPKVQLPKEYGGGEATVIAWLWARTVECPNPACGAQMPLVRSFALSTKKGKQAWVEPVIDSSQQPVVVNFNVKTGEGKLPDGTVNRKGATCICCGTPVPTEYIRTEGKAGRMSAQLMAIVAEGQRQRVYLSPNKKHEAIAGQAEPEWGPEAELPENPRWFSPPLYGLTQYVDLFTPRQLVALSNFSNLVREAQEQIRRDAVVAGMPNDDLPLSQGGTGAIAYADALATYLAFLLDKQADLGNALNRWEPVAQCPRQLFARQAIPMVWDFAEGNPLGSSSGSWSVLIENLMRSFQSPLFVHKRLKFGVTKQLDATAAIHDLSHPLISTDPPYHSNIGYADLSDFFYIWLRRSLGKIYPHLFNTLLIPKAHELVATPYRFGGSKKKAEEFFEAGLGKAFNRMREAAHPDYPLTIFYAFKQSETDDDAEESGNSSVVASTGWENMLEGLLKAGLTINGTWPMRTEMSSRMVGQGTNALASSIVLVCRPRPESAPSTTRSQFLNELKRELPEALHTLQQGNIAPVDLAQASIGPGMAIFSRYAKVLESDGTPMRVRTALQLINQTLDEFLTEQEGEFDSDTRWALAWFEQYQFNEGPYGDAETLSKAKNTSVQALVEAGILIAKGGKVRLMRRDEFPKDWNPAKDNRMPVWEVTQHLIRALDQNGETGAAALLAQIDSQGEVARDLAYRLYSLCDRKGWASEGIAYNSLVISWSEVSQLAAQKNKQPVQRELNFRF